jgi:hypothetical protein
MGMKSQLLCATCAFVVGLASPRTTAYADEVAVQGDRVTLAMILPALAGSELGGIDIAAAPLPGERSVIRASDIRAKLKANGRDARGLDIPRTVKLVRRSRSLDSKELDEMVRSVLAPQVAPCDVAQLSPLEPVTIGDGEFELEAQPMARKQSGRTQATITLRQGERSQHISAHAVLHCPEPVMLPGNSIRLVAVAGAVRVSAPGTANQPGRVGDEIRVTNQLTKRALKARVIDAQTAEVIQ